MATAPAIPLRFQRAEFESKADLSPQGRAVLAANPHPTRLIEALGAAKLDRDAVHALALMLPHRQVVWWGCLAARLLPDLDRRKTDLAAIAAAEAWTQNPAPAQAEQAAQAADQADRDLGPAWVATAAGWAGPSLAPRGQSAVPPPPHLPGTAVRTALVLLMLEPALQGRVSHADWLELGLALMRGENGSAAQGQLRRRLFEPAA
ncbi:DUF6931 family protein [Novosphingobium bradum]|uniref:DUF6931 family protein n=1 Tax=Novosphingobium bradum TaxID=1737444 RepID=A0ABV7IRI7_9SPHN